MSANLRFWCGERDLCINNWSLASFSKALSCGWKLDLISKAGLLSPPGSLPLPTAKMAGSINSISPALAIFPLGVWYGFLNKEDVSSKWFPRKWHNKSKIKSKQDNPKTLLKIYIYLNNNQPDIASKACSVLSWEEKPGGGALLGTVNPGGAEIWALEAV